MTHQKTFKLYRVTRIWIPSIGDRVKLATFSDYSSCNISTWSWLEVQDIQLNLTGQEIGIEVLNGMEHTGVKLAVPLSSIAPPIGWKPRYTITVKPEKLTEVLSWFTRGITVRQSHYMPSCPTSFQPMDNDSALDWRFNGSDCDRVPPELCDSVFAISVLELEYDCGVDAPCKYCVNGKRTPENNPVLIGHDSDTCPHCGVIAGFSFDKPHHPKGYRYGYVEGISMDDSQCANVAPPAQCWTCSGTGKGKRYLSEMKPKERKATIAAWKSEGWEVTYLRGSDPCWVRERKTVVKQFGQSASTVRGIR